MPDFTATRTFLYVAGNIISPVQNTANETGIYDPHNAAFNGTSGHKHSGNTGDGPLIGILSPTARTVVGATGALAATDYYIGVDHTAAKTITFTQDAANDFVRDVVVYDYTGNAGTFNISVVFAGGWTCQGLTTIVLCADYDAIRFHYNGTNWVIV